VTPVLIEAFARSYRASARSGWHVPNGNFQRVVSGFRLQSL